MDSLSVNGFFCILLPWSSNTEKSLSQVRCLIGWTSPVLGNLTQISAQKSFYSCVHDIKHFACERDFDPFNSYQKACSQTYRTLSTRKFPIRMKVSSKTVLSVWLRNTEKSFSQAECPMSWAPLYMMSRISKHVFQAYLNYKVDAEQRPMQRPCKSTCISVTDCF